MTRDEAVVNVGITHETALRQSRRQERHAAPRLEGPSAGPDRWLQDGGECVPLPAGNERMEQGRAPLVFLHEYELAWTASAQLRNGNQFDWRNDHH